METVYDAFKGRQAQRRKALVYFLALLTFFILLGVYIDSNARWFLGAWYIIGLFTLLFAFFYGITRSWTGEMNETNIFVDFYKAFRCVKMSRGEDIDPKFYSRKASNHVKDAIENIQAMYYGKSMSKLLNREFAEPLKQLQTNLETIVLPRIVQHKDDMNIVSVLRGLAKLFGEVQRPISLDDIISKNKDLERFKPIKLEESRTRLALRTIVTGRPLKFTCSMFLGYLSIVVVFWILSQFLSFDFVESLRNNIPALVSGGAVVSGIIASLLILKK